jgi:cardiolipin synthase (CMP-forming)
MHYTLPNLLTMGRIAVIPVMVPLLWLPGAFWAWAACGLFALAAATDWLDGYLARARKESSDFGRFLDPIADKLLVAATLMMLVATRRIEGYVVLAALVILCREIMVSGLREFLAGLRVGLPVSKLAKWKTTVQLLSIGVLIVGDYGQTLLPLPIQLIGEWGLIGAALVTLVTGWDYLRAGLSHMDGNPNPTKDSQP